MGKLKIYLPSSKKRIKLKGEKKKGKLRPNTEENEKLNTFSWLDLVKLLKVQHTQKDNICYLF